MRTPKITFGIIVLNGEPFTRYCLRSIYPFAHEIVVVEGANPSSASIATSDGHSTDGTLETLQRFIENEDPDKKVRLIVKDGFWSEKHEQSQAYAGIATGEYLWQVDIDEFYRPEDMETIIEMLSSDPDITAMSFKQITFWGGFDYIADGWHLREGAEIYHRLFKWGKGYRYATHRPPTALDSQGRDLRTVKWIDGYALSRHGVYLYHYSLVFPRHVLDKCRYYAQASWSDRTKACEWAEDNYLKLNHPYRVHNIYERPSWLERFHGCHPPEILTLRQDILNGLITVETRPTQDVEALLKSPKYRLGRGALKILSYAFRHRGKLNRFPFIKKWFKRLVNQ
jgi:hypothetical protein